MLLLFASNAAKLMVNGCPESALSQMEMARQLPISPGTAVAVVGAGNYSYWAHFAQLRIVADIMSPDELEFWRLTEEKRQLLFAVFRTTGAEAIIAQPPDLALVLDSRWKQVGTTTYYYYPLRQ
jgi:ornithine cyclodeaminase/alanine dehydrogenase-like protein (mu-crystallin family)